MFDFFFFSQLFCGIDFLSCFVSYFFPKCLIHRCPLSAVCLLFQLKVVFLSCGSSLVPFLPFYSVIWLSFVSKVVLSHGCPSVPCLFSPSVLITQNLSTEGPFSGATCLHLLCKYMQFSGQKVEPPTSTVILLANTCGRLTVTR